MQNNTAIISRYDEVLCEKASKASLQQQTHQIEKLLREVKA